MINVAAEKLIDCMSNIFILRVHINDFENLKMISSLR